VGILMMPWKLMTSFSSYIFGWLVGCSALLGPIAGIMIFDYYLVRKRRLQVEDLYVRGGIYEYNGGFNGWALLALGSGVGVALVGLLVPAVRWLYDYAWFVGFFVSGVLYYLFMQSSRKATANEGI
jgi:NCS1 family nucleobase:cation symporter-1